MSPPNRVVASYDRITQLDDVTLYRTCLERGGEELASWLDLGVLRSSRARSGPAWHGD